MKRILTVISLFGITLFALSQEPAAELRKSGVSSGDNENGVWLKDGRVLFSRGKMVKTAEVQNGDLVDVLDAEGIPYCGDRSTYAYDSKNGVLYFVKSNHGESYICSDNNHVIPAAGEFKRTSQQISDGSTLLYSSWLFGSGRNFAGYSARHPYLSEDGRRLYFSSNLSGGYGNYDIWYITREGIGWSAPINAGNLVNSSGNEDYPSFYGDIMLFSSDRGGNYDLYSLLNGQIKKLDALNSGSEDINPLVLGNLGIFVSDRDGHDDIYLFDASYLKPVIKKAASQPEVKREVKPEVKPASKLISKEEEEVIDAAFKNLLFETGKSVIKSGFSDLDALALLLNKYPHSRCELSGYTDSTGSLSLNNKLSEERAVAVKKYLISKDVKESRISASGYGPRHPVSSNSTASGRAKNRRVEIKVIK